MSAEGHDHAMDEHEHHHKDTFITKYIFSIDHKMIAKQYLITGIFMGIIGLVCLCYLECNWHGQSNHSRYSIFYLVINLLEWSYGQRYLPRISHHTVP
jgi:hypothetical protein